MIGGRREVLGQLKMWTHLRDVIFYLIPFLLAKLFCLPFESTTLTIDVSRSKYAIKVPQIPEAEPIVVSIQ